MKLDEIRFIADSLNNKDRDIWVQTGVLLLASETPIVQIYSDISKVFVDTFGDFLRTHHFKNNKHCSEDNFLLGLIEAWKAEGRLVKEPSHRNHKGEDVICDNVRYSLKTESGKRVNPSYVNISKIIESGWLKDGIFDVRHVEQRNAEVIARVNHHLTLYEHVWVLRSFPSGNNIKYDLVEIPKYILEQVSQVKPSDFWAYKDRMRVPFTKTLTRHADVTYKGATAWRLYIDGSDGKISLKNIDMKFCRKLVSWELQNMVKMVSSQ